MKWRSSHRPEIGGRSGPTFGSKLPRAGQGVGSPVHSPREAALQLAMEFVRVELLAAHVSFRLPTSTCKDAELPGVFDF